MTGPLPRRFDLAPLFDVTVFSFEVGLLKPDPEIFRYAARQLHVEPAACAFVDDWLDYLRGGAGGGDGGRLLEAIGHPLRPVTGEYDVCVEDLRELLACLPERGEA